MLCRCASWITWGVTAESRCARQYGQFGASSTVHPERHRERCNILSTICCAKLFVGLSLWCWLCQVARFVEASNNAIVEKLQQDIHKFSEITALFKPRQAAERSPHSGTIPADVLRLPTPLTPRLQQQNHLPNPVRQSVSQAFFFCAHNSPA